MSSRPPEELEVRREGATISLWAFGLLGGLSAVTGFDQLYSWLPFFVAIFLFGLPHGAADWLLLSPSTSRDAVRVFALYSLAGLVTGLLAWIEPRPAIYLFFILSILHFGSADGRDLQAIGPARSSVATPIAGIARMAAFLALLSWLHIDEVAALFHRVETILGNPGTANSLAVSIGKITPSLFGGALVGWGLSVLVRLIQSRRELVSGNRARSFFIEILEGILLLAAAVYLNPVFAVGLYFLSWHAFRHSLLVAQRLFGPTSGTGLCRALFRMHLHSWPLYLPTLPLMGLLIWRHGNLHRPEDWVASLLVVFMIFTLPHHFIVERWLSDSPRGATPNVPQSSS